MGAHAPHPHRVPRSARVTVRPRQLALTRSSGFLIVQSPPCRSHYFRSENRLRSRAGGGSATSCGISACCPERSWSSAATHWSPTKKSSKRTTLSRSATSSPVDDEVQTLPRQGGGADPASQRRLLPPVLHLLLSAASGTHHRQAQDVHATGGRSGRR